MSYNGGYNGGGNRGGFQPKPRPVLPPEHELDPLIEAVIANKRELRNFAQPGNVASTAYIQINGKNIPVPLAAMMATHQYAVPYDHSNAYPIRKLNSQFPDNAYVVIYEGHTKPRWAQDESFWYIPTFSRYVINKDGHVKNAYNGRTVSENAYANWTTELVPDGPANMLRKVSSLNLSYLAMGVLPKDFTDYGFGTYSHKLWTDAEKNCITWVPLPKVQVKSSLSGAVIEQPNVQEFMKTFIKDFNEQKAAREQLKYLEQGVPMRAGEFTVTYVGMAPAAPTAPAAQEVAQSYTQQQPQAPQAPAAAPGPSFDFDENIAF